MRIARDLNTAENHAETIEELDLSGQDLVEIPEFVWEMPELRVLNLSGNRIAATDLKFGKLVGLQSLSLENMDMRSLPSDLFLLENLDTLKVSKNDLWKLPDELAELRRLRVLHADKCGLAEWPVALCAMPRLEFLSLAGNQLHELPGAVRGLRSLKWLDLSENYLEELPSELALIAGLKDLVLGRKLRADSLRLDEGDAVVTRFFSETAQGEMALNLRQVCLEILTQNIPALMERPVGLLLETLSVADAELRGRAPEMLYSALPDPFQAGKPASVCLLGDFENLHRAQLKQQLAEMEIELVAKPESGECVVIAGGRPGKRLEKGLALNCRVGMEGHLHDFLAREEGKYLAVGKGHAKDMVGNIVTMLRSGNDDTVVLALNLMETGGIPADALSDVMGIALFGSLRWREARALLEHQAPKRIAQFLESLIRFDKKGKTRVADRKRKILLRTLQNPELDQVAVAHHALSYFLHKEMRVDELILELPEAAQVQLFPRMLKDGYLDLAKKRLDSIPPACLNLQGLLSLDLSDNVLEKLPHEVDQMQDLETLVLTGNRLQGLPDSFYRLSALKNLRLDGNRFHSLSEDLGRMPELEVLVLSENPLEDLPSSFAEEKRLRYLDLRKCFAGKMPASVSRIGSLLGLGLRECGLTSLDDWQPEWRGMESLNLSINPLKRIPDWVGELPAIKTLDLSHTPADGLPEGLANASQLEYLYLPLVGKLDWNQLRRVIRGLPSLKKVFYDQKATPEFVYEISRGMGHVQFRAYPPRL